MKQSFFKRIYLYLKKSLGGLSYFASSLMSVSGQSNMDYYQRWVFACVNLIANSLARVEWKLYKMKGGQTEEILEHPLISLLYKFNPKSTKFDSIKNSVVYFLVHGESPWMIDNKNNPKEINILPPDSLKVKTKDEFGIPLTYELNLGQNKKLEIPADQIIPLKNPKPGNPSKGQSVVDAIKDVLETDYEMTIWNKNLMKNNAAPSGVIKLPGTLDEKQAKLMRKIFENQTAGPENARKTSILINGAQYDNISFSPQELDYSGARGANRDEILAMFGVPKILLGLEGGYNRATAETAERVFAKYTLEPIMELIIQELNEFLVPLFGDDLWLSYEPLANEDKEVALEEYKAGINLWLTPNEIRDDLGLEALSGGDYIYMPIMNAPLIGGKNANPVKTVKLKGKSRGILRQKRDQLIIKRIKVRNARRKNWAKGIADAVEDKIINIRKKVLILKSEHKCDECKDETTDKKKAVWEKTMEVKKGVEKRLAEKMFEILQSQKEQVLKNIGKLKKSVWTKAIDDVMFDYDEEVKTTIEILKPEFVAAMLEGSELASQIMPGQEPVDISKLPEVQKWVKKIVDKYGETITETTYDDVLNKIKQMVDDGESVSTIKDSISEYFDVTGKGRAEVIARTESARALTSGEVYTWEQYGVKDFEWYLAGNEPCDVCQVNSVQDWPADKAKLGTIEYAHPNCECLFNPK